MRDRDEQQAQAISDWLAADEQFHRADREYRETIFCGGSAHDARDQALRRLLVAQEVLLLRLGAWSRDCVPAAWLLRALDEDGDATVAA